MAQPFIVPTVCRFTINATYGTRPVANIIDMHIDTTGTFSERETSIQDQGGILLNQWHTDILPLLSVIYKAQSVSWVDLNNDTGPVGERNTSGGHTWPAAGGFTGSAMPGNVAFLVRKLIGGVRGAKSGRMYVPGVDESATFSDQNNVTDTTTAAMNVKWASFLDNINQDSGLSSYSSYMVVSHILTRYPPKPSQAVGSPHTGQGLKVSGLVQDTLLATQRRRLRG